MRLVSSLALTLAIFLFLTVCPPAGACPFCDGGESGTNEVRAAIFGDEFWPNLLTAAAPFALLLGITVAVYVGLPGRRASSDVGEPEGR